VMRRRGSHDQMPVNAVDAIGRTRGKSKAAHKTRHMPINLLLRHQHSKLPLTALTG
jgi:hypothetical protein